MIVVGGVAYAFLHYGVWGAHLMSIGANARWGEVSYLIVQFVIPVILSASLLILATSAVGGIEEGVIFDALVTISAVVLLATIASVARSRKRRSEWQRAADAAANTDAELGEALRAAGWRPDGSFEEMKLIWFQTLPKVNRARVLADLPIFEGPLPP